MSTIDKETALAMFENFCSDWDIDTDISDLSEEETQEFENCKKKIIRKIMSGHLSYNDDETFSYQPYKPLKSGEISGVIKIKRTSVSSTLEMDKYKEDQKMKKFLVKMAEATEKPISFLSQLDDIDSKVIQAVMLLFLT